jgi:type IV secretion system protein VirB10
MTAAPPRRPPPPVATRLHRGALVLVGVLVVLTAAVGLHYLAAPAAHPGPDGSAADSLAGAPPPPPQQPAFADPPAAAPAEVGVSAPPIPAVAAAGDTTARRPMPGASGERAHGHRGAPIARALRGGLLVDGSARESGGAASLIADPLSSPCTLAAGTILSAILVTEVNSDLPGPIVAQLAHDVYDSRTQQLRLLPAGTRLIGRYDAHVVAGQGRLLVVWERLVLPDAEEIAVPDLPSIDAHGAAGIADAVDNHLGRVFGTAALMSAVGAAAQLSQPTTGGAFAAPTAGSVAAGAIGSQMSNAGLDVLRRNAEIPPTITARAGLAVGVLLGRALVLPGPYIDTRP